MRYVMPVVMVLLSAAIATGQTTAPRRMPASRPAVPATEPAKTLEGYQPTTSPAFMLLNVTLGCDAALVPE